MVDSREGDLLLVQEGKRHSPNSWLGEESEAARAHCEVTNRTAAVKNLSRLLVPEERERNQGNGDDPEHDVFSAIFFFRFGHRRSTAYMKLWFKCRSDFLY